MRLERVRGRQKGGERESLTKVSHATDYGDDLPCKGLEGNDRDQPVIDKTRVTSR